MVERLRAIAGKRAYLCVVIAVLLLLAATEPPKAPHTSSFANGAAVARWMVDYYRQPEPNRMVDAIAVLSAEGGLKSEHRLETVAAFLAGVIDQDSAVVGPILEHAVSDLDEQNLVAGAAVLSRQRNELVPAVTAKLPATEGKIAKLLADPEAADILRRPIGNAAAVDFYWAYFMATGSDEVLARIVASVAGTLQPTDLGALMTGYAAKWSLTFNAATHARVMDACRAAAAEESAIAGALADVVAAAEAGDTRRIRHEWQAAEHAWKAQRPSAQELSAIGAKRGA